MAGQTINDRLLAAKHSLAGQGLAKSVCKATTEELLGPKKKHLDYLVHCTNEPNVSIPQLANLLIERSQNTNWVVVFKALITTHHIMCYGNERFTQYLASSNSSFQLSNFVDKSGIQGANARTGYDMSPFIRRYARYLNEKALSYRTVAFDFCKVKRGKEEGTLRTMNTEKLLKTLPVLQSQLDALLEFDCTANDLTNGVINMAFMLLFRDLIRLFAGYNDAIINLLEKYFDMNKKQCREALDLYKKFLIRMDRVGEFLKVAENIGIDKGDIPDLTKAPNSLLDALEQHLASLEGNTPTQIASNQKNVKSGVSVLSNTSNAFGTAATNNIDETFKQQAVAEEEAALNQYKASITSPAAASTNPFLDDAPAPSPTPAAPAPANTNQQILDLFGTSPATTAPASGAPASKASDDLLQLGNPFADMFSAPATSTTTTTSAPPSSVSQLNDLFTSPPMSQSQASTAMWNSTTLSSSFATQPTTVPVNSFGQQSTTSLVNTFGTQPTALPANGFVPQAANAFGAAPTGLPATTFTTQPNTFMAQPTGMPATNFGQPTNLPANSFMPTVSTTNAFTSDNNLISVFETSTSEPSVFDPLNNDILKPSAQIAPTPPVSMAQMAPQKKVLTGDLESSLASLAENLTISTSKPSAVQWNSPKNAPKPGNVAGGWQPQPMAATTGMNYRPMGTGMQFPMGAGAPMGGTPAPPMGSPRMIPPQQTVPAAGAPVKSDISFDPFGDL